MAIENEPLEDVFLIEHEDFPLLCYMFVYQRVKMGNVFGRKYDVMYGSLRLMQRRFQRKPGGAACE